MTLLHTTRLLLLALCLLTPGCIRIPMPWQVNRATAVQTAEAKVDTKKEELAKKAQEEVVIIRESLSVAEPSRPVEVAKDAADKADRYLNEAIGPVPEKRTLQLEQLVKNLLSDNAAIRAKAEAQRDKDALSVAKLASKVVLAEDALKAQEDKLAAAYTDNLYWRKLAVRVIWTGIGLAVLCVVLLGLYVWLQVATGGIPKAIGGLLKGLDQSDPDKANLIRSLLDPVTNRIEQALIRKHT